MESYSPLLERTRVPQPSIQRLAVISIFEKLRRDGPDTEAVKSAISHCLLSNSPAVVDQSVRELCRTVAEGKMELSQGLLELQVALDGCYNSRFIDVFVKGIGFLCRFGFRKDPSWRFESAEAHPFVRVLSSQTEAQSELVHQVLLFIVQNKAMGFARMLKFLRPFLMFSVLRIPSCISSSSFVKQLISAMASLACSFASEAVPLFNVIIECLKYSPRGNVEEFKYLISSIEYVVDAFVAVLKHSVSTRLPSDDLQVCSVELLDTALSLCTDLHMPYAQSEPVIELSKRLLFAQKELHLRYLPDFASVVASLFLILTQAEFEHEQLSILKLSLFLLKWKHENDYITGRTTCSFSEELLFLFPVINLLASPSKSVKAAAIDLLSILEMHLADFVVCPKILSTAPVEFPSTRKPQSITFRLLHHLWTQGHSSSSNSYFLKFASIGKAESKGICGETNSWLLQLRDYSLTTAMAQKSTRIFQSQENLLAGMPLLLGAVVAVLVTHPTLGSSAVDALDAIGVVDPKLGVTLFLSILFYNKIFCRDGSYSHDIVLKLLGMLPSLASHPVMVPLVVQSILPMLHKDAKLVLFATAVRLLCKTWEVTDRVFGNLQGILQPTAFSEFVSERHISISMASSVRDVCKRNADRGVDLILSVSACIESQDPIVQALGFEGLGNLCEADVVDFYTAWDVIQKHVLDYSVHPIIACGLCSLLRWGATDAQAYSEASKKVVQVLWEIGSFKGTGYGKTWIKARTSAFESLTHYEVDHVRQSIPDFSKKNMELFSSEHNLEVLRAMESLEVKIINFEHITRRRLLKEKRVLVSKVEKLLDVFPQVMFFSGKGNAPRDLPGAALLSVSFNPKDMQGQGNSKELVKLYAAYESALLEIADSIHLSRNILLALLALQSWEPFMQRWMRAVILFLDSKMTADESDKASKASDEILKIICRVAEESLPRSAENLVLAIGALCLILPPSAHSVTLTASKCMLKWLFQYEHEHRQWTAAISLGLATSCLHATDSRQKFQIISALLEVFSNSKSILVKGACGMGLGFACQDLLTRVKSGDGSNMEEGATSLREATFLGGIVRALSSMISQLCPSSSDSLQNLHENFPLCMDDMHFEETIYLLGDNRMEGDVWGVAALVVGLANSVIAIYRAGYHDAVVKIKDMLLSWIPHVNSFVQNLRSCNKEPEVPLSVGSCLALPTVVAFCQRADLMGDELDDLLVGYKELISELLAVKASGTQHQNFLMASCIGAGNLLSCILNEGLHSVKADNVRGLLELMRSTYMQPYPPSVHLGGMLGVVNALGAGAGILTHMYPQLPSLLMDHEQKESPYIRGPILSSPVCEPLCVSLMQEMFLVAQDSKDRQIQSYAAWAVSFLRYRWWSKEIHPVHVSKSNPVESKSVSQSFPEDSTVWQLCLWLKNLNSLKEFQTHVNTVAAVLRCLSHAPRIPDLDWGAIIRRCMKYEDQICTKLNPHLSLQKGMLQEECICFSLAHSNQVTSLLFFLDELFDLPRFSLLELNLQSFLLSHLADMIKIFSGSRMEKLYDDMIDHFNSSISYQSYNSDQKSILRISFWKGLRRSLNEGSTKFPDYVVIVENVIEELFFLLPELPSIHGQRAEQENCENEWCEALRCLGKAPTDWLIGFLQLPETNLVGESCFTETVKRICAISRLVVMGCLPVTELGKVKQYALNTEPAGIWSALVEVVAALQHVEDSIKRRWLLDAVEISCVAKHPSTVLQFIGLLSGSCCKYMPLLILDRASVLNDLPIILPSLLSNSSWRGIAESLVLNLWASTERIYVWTMQLRNGDVFLGPESIDKSENSRSIFLTHVMHDTCVSLKHYLPFEKQLKLANMVRLN